MIATKTGVRDSDYSNTQYSPIFRVKNLPNSKARLHTTAFINFTVWWESRTAYTKKTYSTNATLHSANSTNTYNCILVDETPDNADFEVVALSDGSSNGYTTYYVNAPTDSAYSGVPAQIVINKCDLLPSIEFLGGRPFDVIFVDASNLIYATFFTNKTLTISTILSDCLISSNHTNKAVIKEDGSLYVDYGIYVNTGISEDGTGTSVLRLNGIKPKKSLKILSPYGYYEATGGGICKFTFKTDSTFDIKYAAPNTITRLTFTLERSEYIFT